MALFMKVFGLNTNKQPQALTAIQHNY